MSESVMAEWEYSCDKCNWIHPYETGCYCEKCQEHPVTLTPEAYGNGQMMKIECPKCGVSYDTNLDPIEGECDKCEDTYELSDRTNRCGNCGNCNNCCTHERESK